MITMTKDSMEILKRLPPLAWITVPRHTHYSDSIRIARRPALSLEMIPEGAPVEYAEIESYEYRIEWIKSAPIVRSQGRYGRVFWAKVRRY